MLHISVPPPQASVVNTGTPAPIASTVVFGHASLLDK